jgi:hypothetical protein
MDKRQQSFVSTIHALDKEVPVLTLVVEDVDLLSTGYEMESAQEKMRQILFARNLLPIHRQR